MTWPVVLDEFATIARIVEGYSLARVGDGEGKIALGAGYSREPRNPKLSAEVAEVIRNPHPNCIVGIPTMDPRGPKYDNWMRHAKRFQPLLNPDLQYYSAFISRPDSSPWISTKQYAEAVQQIWAGQRVAVVCERKCSIYRTVRYASDVIVHIECPHEKAYAEIDEIEQRVLDYCPGVAILSAGPTATCLANRLAARGIHAVDMGSAGGFLGKLLRE